MEKSACSGPSTLYHEPAFTFSTSTTLYISLLWVILNILLKSDSSVLYAALSDALLILEQMLSRFSGAKNLSDTGPVLVLPPLDAGKSTKKLHSLRMWSIVLFYAAMIASFTLAFVSDQVWVWLETKWYNNFKQLSKDLSFWCIMAKYRILFLLRSVGSVCMKLRVNKVKKWQDQKSESRKTISAYRFSEMCYN